MIVLLATVMLFVGAPTQRGGATEPQNRKSTKTEQLEHWRSLDARSKAELTRRYEALQGLSVEDRAKLVERGKRLQREIDLTLRSLGPKERAAVEALEPRERRRVLRGLVGDRARRSATQLRSRLTKEQRAALETAGPRERAAILRDLRERRTSRMSERNAALGRELGLSDSELRRIERGSTRERSDVMVKLVRRRANRHVREHGLPQGVTPEAWRAITAHGDEAFVRGYLRIRASHPEFGVAPRQWEKSKRHGSSLANRLEALSRPTTEQRARSPRSGEAQLRRRVLLAQRGRAEDMLVRAGELSREDAARLRGLDDDAFVAAYRETIQSLRGGRATGRGAGRDTGRRTGRQSERQTGRQTGRTGSESRPDRHGGRRGG